MNLLNLPLESGWKKLLTEEMSKPYFEKIGHNLQTIKDKEEIILPPHDLIFERGWMQKIWIGLGVHRKLDLVLSSIVLHASPFSSL